MFQYVVFSHLEYIFGQYYTCCSSAYDLVLLENNSMVLKVPSAIVPKEYNFIINTKHPDFIDKVSLVRTEDYFWDERLF